MQHPTGVFDREKKVQLITNQGLVPNFTNLLFYFGLLSEEVPGVSIEAAESSVPDLISGFTITINGNTGEPVRVEKGKFKSALLLLYLADLAGSESFIRCESDRQLIVDYFGSDIVGDAVNNPNTKHTTVRDLLADGSVRITVNRLNVA